MFVCDDGLYGKNLARYNLPENPDGPVFYEEIEWLLDLAEENEKYFMAVFPFTATLYPFATDLLYRL